MILCAVLLSTAALDIVSKSFVELRVAGLGRYGASPAIFLQRDEQGGAVLPVPIPRTSEMAFEQALSPRPPSRIEVLLQARTFSNRDGGLFDSLPWQWNPNSLAKRDGYSRLSGRDYPGGGLASPFHLLLNAVRRDACADVRRVLIVNLADEEAESLTVGCRLLLERRLPEAGSARSVRPRDAAMRRAGDDEADASEQGQMPCDCLVDEALGLCIALGASVHVEESVWAGAARTPKYAMLRGQLRVCIEDDPRDDRARLASAARTLKAPKLPWEYESVEAVKAAPPAEKALAALGAGLRLPRGAISAEESGVDEALLELIEPLLLADVRRELRAARAYDEGMVDENELFTIETCLGARERLTLRMEAAVEVEDYAAAAAAQAQLAAETAYLDELLETIPRPAFQAEAAARYAAVYLEAAGAGAEWLDAFLDEPEGDWFDAARASERERTADVAFCIGYLSQFREQLAIRELLAALDDARGSNAAKEERLRAASEAASAADALDDDCESGVWSDGIASRVARQLVFASSSYSVAASVGRVDLLMEDARRGEGSAQEAMRELVRVTTELEALQERRRGGAEGQRQLEDERRALVAELRTWADADRETGATPPTTQ